MEIYTIAQLYRQAVRLIEAMITTGPDNEQELQLALALLTPDPDQDNFASLMKDSNKVIEAANRTVLRMLEENAKRLDDEDDDE